MNFKKRIFKMLFNKRQRAIIWQAILFSEHTYKRRGNVNAAAMVQTVINETEKIFGFNKSHFTKEEVDEIVAGVLNEGKAYIQDAFRKGAEVSEEKIKEAYNEGFKRCIEEIEKRVEKDEESKSAKLHVCEIDLSDCKSKEDILEKIAKTIADDLLGKKSDNKEEDNKSDGSQESSNESQESSDGEQQSKENQSEDGVKENE